MGNILIAKKPEYVADLISRNLQKAGHTTELTSSAREAVLRILEVKFDAVLSGLSLDDNCGSYNNLNSGIEVVSAASKLGIKNVVLISSIPHMLNYKLPDDVKIWDSPGWNRASIQKLLDMIDL